MKRSAWIVFLTIGMTTRVLAGELKVGASASRLVADDTLVIGGGIGPGKASGQEGELRGGRGD